MKLLTTNFLTCAVKACKSSSASFPLHPRDAELEQSEMEYNPLFLKNILPRLEWGALREVALELGLTNLPAEKPEFAPGAEAAVASIADGGAEGGEGGEGGEAEAMDTDMGGDSEGGKERSVEEEDQLLRELHTILLETHVVEGKLVCGNCGHEYRIKEGIANFLLPAHLV